MSFSLPKIDLTNANVGDKFFLDLENSGIPQDFVNMRDPAHMRFYNDSCMGLDCSTVKDGHQFYIPQGAWPTIEIRAQETGINIVCSSQMLPVPSICFLKPVYYGPGEPLDDLGVLGNTPQNIGGTIQTSSVQTLTNEGAAAGGLVVDIGDLALAQLIKLFTDHFSLAVDQAGVAHFVLRGSTTGNATQISQTGDTAEVLGSLLVDQNETVTGGLTVNGGGNTAINVTSGGITSAGSITVNVAGAAAINVTSGGITTQGLISHSGASIDGGTLNVTNLINANSGVNLIENFIHGITSGTFTPGAVTGTQAHGMAGTPFCVLLCCDDPANASTTTYTADNYTSTQFSWRVNNTGIQMRWIAFR